jgi:hypothetical protein
VIWTTSARFVTYTTCCGTIPGTDRATEAEKVIGNILPNLVGVKISSIYENFGKGNRKYIPLPNLVGQITKHESESNESNKIFW